MARIREEYPDGMTFHFDVPDADRFLIEQADRTREYTGKEPIEVGPDHIVVSISRDPKSTNQCRYTILSYKNEETP